MRWEGGAGFRIVLSQNDCKRPSESKHELRDGADLFSAGLQHASPLTIVTDRRASPSHPLGARRVIGARTWLFAVQTSPTRHSGIDKGRRGTLSSRHRIAEETARARPEGTRRSAQAHQPLQPPLPGHVAWLPVQTLPLVLTQPIGFLGL